MNDESFVQWTEHFFKQTDLMQNENILVKTILLKLLKKYEYLDAHECEKILEDFTFEKILSKWSNVPVDPLYRKVQETIPTKVEQDVIQRYMEASSPVKTVSPCALSIFYEKSIHLVKKKGKGIFYTPKNIRNLMVSMENFQWEKMKILDPSCGSGLFLHSVYRKFIVSSADQHRNHEHALRESLHGFDTDLYAVITARLSLSLYEKQYVEAKNIHCLDALLETDSFSGTFDYVVGNPPYIGHKQIEKDYAEQLKGRYGDVFYNKGDLSYCFFKKGIELLNEKGRLTYVVSRYFVESLSGQGIRSYIKHHRHIEKMIDFNGRRILKGIQVDPFILTLDPFEKKKQETRVFRYIKVKDENHVYRDIDRINDPKAFDRYCIKAKQLHEKGWFLMNSQEFEVIEKVDGVEGMPLKKLWHCNQGVITGCDKAFVIEQAQDHPKEYQSFLKPWIKSTNIQKFTIREGSKALLYTNALSNIDQYPYIKQHMLPFKSKLENRRECKNGLRKWYHLQWGRKQEIFEQAKIIFPYKAKENRFAYDAKGCYYSADIYGFSIREEHADFIGMKELVLLLNSRLYDFYIRAYAKKLGEGLIEYYPNTLEKINIPRMDESIRSTLRAIYDKIIASVDPKPLMDDCDLLIYDLFHLNDSQRRFLNKERRIKDENN
ncbi:MAG TPA: hypothetical protein DHN33_06220 [Eubacteriaceae bacterium]|nr:hypothetical protein [Eubacteriaceae bacterium]